MSAPENKSLNELAATKTRRKAPLPRFALKPSIYEQAEQLWQDTLEALLMSGSPAPRSSSPSSGSRTQKKTGGQNASGGDEQTSGVDAVELVRQLQDLVTEHEAAADVAAEALSALSWDQLQTLQVVLDKVGHELLSDFIHITAFHTSDPFAKALDGNVPGAHANARGWKARRKRRAQAAAEKIKKHEPEAAAATAQAVPAHADAWRERQGAAHQQGPVPPEMAKYAQMLAGRHWRPPQASDDAAAAAGGATGAAGGRASIAGAQRNAWQRASMVAGEHRALGMARQSIALASSSAAASPANAHAAAQHSDHTAPAANGARQPSYTGLSYAAWHPAAAGKVLSAGTAPGESAGPRRRFSTVFDGGGGGQIASPPAPPAAPALDANFLGKSPGPYLAKSAQVIRRELHEQQLAEAALDDCRSSVQS
ncbi:hypothetical protein COCSUDRAFT_62248 [Coccomyxa subellipsoidea C-169]|uniref:Uncharacterized protein n=1 Tax=Coccomyxa subellipsoidea (strain C-169) TaxID=574566 RepID=I0Z2H3_COCSC|nr:hypothetical protein COCSUDRAFT_62248 [Coccomyxa subellipsoidea C-169]EIE24842.1 hypothetical protein COCSUDRAFT_62248 [Coccomyxa subellipsoidea C-169]|eukprot:XP_005649386.1 hypothetical protein COCSUDRAFT_62248 [Coccomyxa subellipsoidea C-169]